MTTTTLNELHRDWAALARTATARRALQRWRDNDPHQTLCGIATVEDIVTRLHGGASRPEGNDALLAVLIGAAQHGDEIAMRTLLEGFRPLAITLTARCARAGADRHDAASEVLLAIHQRILAHPIEQRTRMIGGYLALTVRRQLNRPRARRALAPSSTVSLDDLAEHTQPADHGERGGFERIAATVTAGIRQHVIDRHQGRLVLLVAAGHTITDIAAHEGTDRSVMSRRLSAATTALHRIAA